MKQIHWVQTRPELEPGLSLPVQHMYTDQEQRNLLIQQDILKDS